MLHRTAVPMVDFRVVDEDMKTCPATARRPGEIVLRAPFLTLGYNNQPERPRHCGAGGYLHTQDVAVMHPDGFVQIVDRIKDVIKTGGEWVSSIEIEGLIGDCRTLSNARSIGVQDAKWGNGRWRCRGARPGSALSPDDVRHHLLRHARRNASAGMRCRKRTALLCGRNTEDECGQDRQETAAQNGSVAACYRRVAVETGRRRELSGTRTCRER